MGSTLSVLLGLIHPANAIHYIPLVTGANAGIGFLTALELAKRGAKVYVAARSLEKGQAAVAQINEEINNNSERNDGMAVFIHVDLVDLNSVKRAAEDFVRQESRLDILLNSAGILIPDAGCTEAGIELHFATNVLGHYLLTRLLLPVLKQTAATSPPGSVRIVNVASLGYAFAPRGGVCFDDMPNAMPFTFGIYGQSKMGNCVFSQELARRYGNAGIVSLAVNPGNLHTALWRHDHTLLSMKTFVRKYPAEWGAQTLLYACASSDIELADTGRWIAPWARKAHCIRKEVSDPGLGIRLWDWCEQQIKDAGVQVPEA